MQVNSFQMFHVLYEESKFWIAVIGAFWSVFKGVSWVKDTLTGFTTSLDTIRNNDLHHIQLGVNELQSGIKEQTTSIVNELKEMRNDIRTFYPSRSSRKKSRGS